MPIELPKAYDPKEAQQKWLTFWDERGYFHADPAKPGEAYTIVIPPPNVTGALHMGHALNNTLQDVLIRWRRMQGRNTLWMPGTDHAGIATQAVVERLLTSEDKSFKRREYGREALVAKIWEWKDKYEARILGQLKQIGASCDWTRTRFTLDDVCAKAVRETFFRMFRDGYIYRGKRLVNWDTQLQTSVADDETYTETTKGGFWTFKYAVIGPPVGIRPVPALKEIFGKPSVTTLPDGTIIHADGLIDPNNLDDSHDKFIEFSTTRPETMLGDCALCVHPDDLRYIHLIGNKVRQPHTGREIPIIADGLLADPELGTGCVKVTPAHDPNDYACWTRNPQIGIINILNPDGTIAAGFGEYSGLDRAKAREAVIAKMEEIGQFIDKQDRDIPLPYSDRSKTPIEPFLSDQWFVKMAERDDGKPGLAQLAMDAVTSGKVKFFPDRYAKTYLDWLGEKRDWCISRQLWWGHRIPVWKMQCGSSTAPALEQIDPSMVAKNASIRSGLEANELQLRKLFAASGVSETAFVLSREDEHGIIWCCLLASEGESALRELESYIASRDEFFLPDEHGNLKDAMADLQKYPILKRSGARFSQVIEFSQETDVLDTWFSSALWPHSTLGWPKQTPELKRYYPTSTLCTSRDIITLWVARMVLTGLYNVGDIPFHNVYVHPKILDGFGETMSKSKGNGADPLDIIDIYGTDALRYGMVALATDNQDSRMPIANMCPHCGELNPQKREHQSGRTKKMNCSACKKPFRPSGAWNEENDELPTAKAASDRFELGRNFANKLWNATRFILMNLEGYTPAPIDPKTLAVEDRWIVSRLATTANAVTAALEAYKFADVARLVYEFAWSEFCDWYIEMSKARRSDPTCQRVLVGVLDGILRLIHPVMPFVAESLWDYLGQAASVRGFPTPKQAEDAVCIAAWPSYPADLIDASTETAIARMQDTIRAVRELRNRYQLDKAQLALSVKCNDDVAKQLNALSQFITSMGQLSSFECGPAVVKPTQAGSVIAAEFEAYIPLAGLIDPVAETKRLEKQIADLSKQLGGLKGKLANESFVKNASAEVVAETRDKVAELEKQIGTLEGNLADVQAG